MYKGVDYSKSKLVVAVTAAAICAIAALGYKFTSDSALAQSKSIKQRVTLRQAELSDLEVQGGEAALAAANERAQAWSKRLVHPDTIDKLVDSLGQAWTYNKQASVTADQAVMGALVAGDIRYLETSVADWPVIVETIEKFESLSPLLSIREIAIVSDGDTSARRFASVRFSMVYKSASQ